MICEGCKEEVFRGRFNFELKQWLCKNCDPRDSQIANLPGSIFPFYTTNLGDRKTIKVQSLRHLRRLESQHGVQSVAFNVNSNNFDIPPRGR